MQNVSIFRNIFKGRITNIESTVPKYIISTIIYDILLGVSILSFVYNFDI
jgi:molybdopterin-binding protein